VVEGWDDPRLYTLTGLRRRGIPIQALNEFLDLVPVTRRGNDNYIQHSFFDHVIKGWLDKHCPRYLAVSEPVHVELTNIGDKETKTYNALHFPNDPS
jgi:glutaminyl-tRNA synthetase